MWVIASTLLLLALLPASAIVLRGDALDRLIGMTLAGVIMPLAFVTVAIATERTVYLEVAVILALVSFSGTMVYVYFLERWL